MKTKIYNLIIIDESGSMHVIKNEAIDSVNETIQTIRAAQNEHEEQEHYVTLVTFNNEVKTIYECVSVEQVQELTSETYRPGCRTALYDAMGVSLNALRTKVADGDKVVVTVVTDGLENASKEYHCMAIKALVEELKENDWVFAYIGANHDVQAAAAAIAITNTLCFETTSEGVENMGVVCSSARTRLFDQMAHSCFCAKEANENFFNDAIYADVKMLSKELFEVQCTRNNDWRLIDANGNMVK